MRRRSRRRRRSHRRPVPGRDMTDTHRTVLESALFAVQAASEQPCTSGLAAPVGTAEQISMVDAVVPDRLLQRPSHLILPDDLGKGLGAISAVEGERHTQTLTRRADSARAPRNLTSAA